MTDLQAAVGLVQLAKLDGFIDERAQWAKWYAEELASFGGSGAAGARTAAISLAGLRHGRRGRCSDQRNDLMARLHELGVGDRAPGRTR